MKNVFQYTDQRKILAKRKEFEAKTGVLWSANSTGRGIVFLPYMDYKTQELSTSHTEKILNVIGHDIDGWRSFLHISSHTGLSLDKVIATCKYLIYLKMLRANVDRMGKLTYVLRIDK